MLLMLWGSSDGMLHQSGEGHGGSQLWCQECVLASLLCEPSNRKRRLALLRPTLFLLYLQPGPFTDVVASFSFRKALPASVSLLPENALMDESRGVSPMRFLNPVKWTMKINHHSTSPVGFPHSVTLV